MSFFTFRKVLLAESPSQIPGDQTIPDRIYIIIILPQLYYKGYNLPVKHYLLQNFETQVGSCNSFLSIVLDKFPTFLSTVFYIIRNLYTRAHVHIYLKASNRRSQPLFYISGPIILLPLARRPRSRRLISLDHPP